MDKALFNKYYDTYNKYWYQVWRFRQKNFLYYNLFSLPGQWKRNSALKKAIALVEKETDFPDIRVMGDQDMIVSLTSFPARIGNLHMVIKSVLLQDYLPGKICLWLTDDEFPQGRESLPEELLALTKYGLEIEFVPGNIRSHNKYYHAFERYPDKTVVTVDDDCIYPLDLISRLVALRGRYPGAVCANDGKDILWDEDGLFPYSKGGLFFTSSFESMTLIALGYGGVLYPPGSRGDAVLDREALWRLAPTADDLWLKAAQIASGAKVAISGELFIHPMMLPGSQKVRLANQNIGGGRNDEQWKKLDEHFGLYDVLRKEYGPVYRGQSSAQ